MFIFNYLRKGLLLPYKDKAGFSLPSAAEGSFSPREINWLQIMRLTVRQLGIHRAEIFTILGFKHELRPETKEMYSCISHTYKLLPEK